MPRATPLPPHSLTSPLLVGRDALLETLTRRFERNALQNGASVILLTGEAGIGKSRVVRELGSRAMQRAFFILQTDCFEQERDVPYAPIRDLLRDAETELRAQFSTRARVSAAQRRNNLDAFVDFVTRNQPALVIVEDVHWCDDASLDALLHLTRRARLLPVIFLFTHRPHELNRALTHFLAELERARNTTESTLTPLSPADVETLLRAIFSQPAPVHPDFVSALHAWTDGNPLFIEETLKALVATGDIFATMSGWTRKPLPQLQIPRSVQDAVQRRTENLSEPARTVLKFAAVCGRRARFALLEKLTHMDSHELETRVQELIVAQLLVEESADELAFRHELTRQAVYTSMLLRERRALHQAVGESIEQTADDTRAGELAYHFDLAHAWEKSFEYALRAGEQARAQYAPRAAVEQYMRALHAAEQLKRAPPLGILRARGRAYETLGEFDAARDDLERVIEAAQTERDAYTEWQAQLDLGYLWIGRDFTRAGENFQRALILARGLDNPTTLASSLNRLGNWHMMLEEPLRARDFHAEALELARALQDPRAIAETLDLLGTTNISAARMMEGKAYYLQAIELFRALNDRSGLASALSMLALCSVQYLGRVNFVPMTATADEALGYAREALEQVRAIGWRAGEALVNTVQGNILGAHGDYGAALDAMQTALAIATEIGHDQWLVISHLALGELYQDILHDAAAQDHFERALEFAKGLNSLYWTRTLTGLLTANLVLQKQLARAKTVLESALTPDMPAVTLGERELWAARAELALAEREPQTALEILERLTRAAEVNQCGENSNARFALARADALGQQGRFDDALAILHEALSASEQERALPAQWRIHHARARLAKQRGLVSESIDHTTRAQHIIENLAATLPPAQREHFLQRALAHPPAKTQFGGLTARERQVAARIAQGKSNRAIAAALVLSERTVEKHVENIMSKLGFDARTQIAAWATRQGMKDEG